MSIVGLSVPLHGESQTRATAQSNLEVVTETRRAMWKSKHIREAENIFETEIFTV